MFRLKHNLMIDLEDLLRVMLGVVGRTDLDKLILPAI